MHTPRYQEGDCRGPWVSRRVATHPWPTGKALPTIADGQTFSLDTEQLKVNYQVIDLSRGRDAQNQPRHTRDPQTVRSAASSLRIACADYDPPMRHRAFRFSLLGMCAFIALWTVPTLTANASSSTCGTYGNYFDSYSDNSAAHSQQYEGAGAHITSTPAATCSTDTSGPDATHPSQNFSNFTTAWVMIASQTTGSYSQDGLIAGYNQGYVYVFAEVNNGNTFYDRYLPDTVAANTTYGFYEKYEGACPPPTNHPCIGSYRGNTRITDTNFDPYASGGFGPQPWSPQFNDQKSYPGNDVMGAPSNHLNFTYLDGQQYSNDQYVSMPCILGRSYPIASRSAIDPNGCTAFDVWST